MHNFVPATRDMPNTPSSISCVTVRWRVIVHPMTTAYESGTPPEILLRHRLRIAREHAGLEQDELAERYTQVDDDEIRAAMLAAQTKMDAAPTPCEGGSRVDRTSLSSGVSFPSPARCDDSRWTVRLNHPPG